MGCLSGAVVQSLASGELARPAAADAAHLESCAACRGRIELARGSLHTAAPASADIGSAATQAPVDIGSAATQAPVDIGSAATQAPVDIGSALTQAPVDIGSAATAASDASLPHGRGGGEALARDAKLGRYVVRDVLGKGGMGVVYVAFDPELDRKVAVKLLRPELAGAAAKARLLREGRAIAKLAHPNVVTVFDVGTHDGSVFVAMELVDGQSLDRWIHPVRPWREVVAVFLQAGEGLVAAHTAGMVHRDFKPANVLMGRDGRVRVTDFGLARLGDGDAEGDRDDAGDRRRASRPSMTAPIERLTQTGAVLGTPAYMAPEQFEAAPVDAKTDQFSFAASLYEALYGERPFAGASLGELFDNITAQRVSPAPAASAVPPWLRQVVLRGLRAEPHERFASLDAMLAELRRDPAAKRRRLAIASTSVLGVGGIAAVAGALAFGGPEPEPPCKDAAAQLATAWTPFARMRVSAAFVATGQPFARDALRGTLATLDTWGNKWIAAHTATCEATHVRRVQSAELLDRRMACLEDRKHELTSFLGLLASADAGLVENAVRSAHRLSSAESCNDRMLATIAPPPATAAAEVTRIRGELADLRALSAAGKYDMAITRVKPALETVQKLGYRPLEAEALFVLSEAQTKLNDVAAAEVTVQKGQLAAEAARDDVLAARFAIQLVDAVAYRQAKHDQAQALFDRAAAAIERLGGDEALSGMLSYYQGAVWLEMGKPTEALAAQQRAYAAMSSALGPEHPYTIAALDARGAAELTLGKYEEALASEQLALELTERTQGVDHPDVAFALDKLGTALVDLGKLAEARPVFERSVKLRSRNPDDPYYGASLINLGDLARREGDDARALELNKQASAVLTRTLGPQHPYVVQALQGQSWLELQLKQPAAALATAQRALATIEDQADSPFWPIVLTRVGHAQLELGDHDSAIATIDRANTLVDKRPDIDPKTKAEIRILFARALKQGGDKTRWMKLAREARALHASFPVPDAEVLAWIDDFLAGKH